ncbi:hypothetical protein E3A20_11820 [Planctomyces bekefii]|uniref:Haloacid dehalogenase n=1 Tax=Planctomyces bekefii TaxID=1653850 RepID=A0A5C6M698_9PLAN|nr:hypothetical protein E3A20_11820 [Planctomyces bekefii]
MKVGMNFFRAGYLQLLNQVLCISLFASSFMMGSPTRAQDVIYLDLGEVVITGNPTDGYKYVPGVLEAIDAMRAQGKKVALLSNIPESWGATCEQKFEKLKDFVGSRLHEDIPMDWRRFDFIVVPPFDRYRKPKPFMFLSALSLGCPGRVAYVGEDLEEVEAASSLGLVSFQKLPDQGLPAGLDLERLLSTFQFQYPDRCDLSPALEAAKEPVDVDVEIAACVQTP